MPENNLSRVRDGSGRGRGKLTIGGTDSFVLSPQLIGPLLKLGRARFGVNCACDLEEIAVAIDLDIRGANPCVVLSHPTRFEPSQTRSYKVEMVQTRPHFGGVRWWFLCPQTGRRVGKLYLPLGGDRFLSRQAYRLVHDTRQMSTVDRLSAKVQRIAGQLGAPHNDSRGPPEKRRGMRWATYDGLVERWHRARDEYWNVL